MHTLRQSSIRYQLVWLAWYNTPALCVPAALDLRDQACGGEYASYLWRDRAEGVMYASQSPPRGSCGLSQGWARLRRPFGGDHVCSLPHTISPVDWGGFKTKKLSYSPFDCLLSLSFSPMDCLVLYMLNHGKPGKDTVVPKYRRWLFVGPCRSRETTPKAMNIFFQSHLT